MHVHKCKPPFSDKIITLHFKNHCYSFQIYKNIKIFINLKFPYLRTVQTIQQSQRRWHRQLPQPPGLEPRGVPLRRLRGAAVAARHAGRPVRGTLLHGGPGAG